MANIRDSAKAFVPKQTKNIAELEIVDLDWPVEDKEGLDKDNNEFKYKVVVKDGEEYRIPNSVLNAIKTIVENKPSQKTVRVVKKGSGLNTVYSVIQLD